MIETPEIGEPLVRGALQRLDRRLRERFGSAYSRLILFGSRAAATTPPTATPTSRW